MPQTSRLNFDIAPAAARGSDIVSVFEAVVRRLPDATALVSGEQRLSYRQLNDRANALAHHLHDSGVRKYGMVALCLERSMEMIVGTIAIMKLGAAYVPIDHQYPLDRIHFIIGEAAPLLTLTTSTLSPAILPALVHPIFLDELALPQKNEESAGFVDLIEPSCPAYVVYTSGTTGQPKGAVLPHSAICRLVCDTNYLHIGAADVLLQHSTCAFDAGIFEIWAALLNGAALVLYPPQPVDITTLKRCIRDGGVTTLLLTTAVFHLVAEQDPACFATLRQVVIGGDVLHAMPVKKIIDLYPHLTIINGYGPTENGVFTCCYVITRNTALGDSIPIGTPITGTNVHILDDQLRPVAPGERGELYTNGLGLARGYLNRRDLTERSFIAVASLPGAPVLYKTGDIVRQDGDGNILFIGRADRQVKIRGFRVEPAEVETALNSLAEVAEAAVLVNRSTSPGTETSLSAYVKLHRQGAKLDASAIRARLMARLPPYMVPASITIVDTFPLNHNGKIDGALLRASVLNGRVAAPESTPPGDPTDIILAVWRDRLGQPELGAHDCIYDYGASSLTSIIVQNELDRRLETATDPLELASAKTPLAWAEVYLKAVQQQKGWEE